MHSSHFRSCSFKDPEKPQEMVYGYETFRDDEGIVVLQSLKVSHLSVIPNSFYESPKLKQLMHKLCKFSQVRSQMYAFQGKLLPQIWSGFPMWPWTERALVQLLITPQSIDGSG